MKKSPFRQGTRTESLDIAVDVGDPEMRLLKRIFSDPMEDERGQVTFYPLEEIELPAAAQGAQASRYQAEGIPLPPAAPIAHASPFGESKPHTGQGLDAKQTLAAHGQSDAWAKYRQFQEMRDLMSYSVCFSDVEIFLAQARFMENFTDDYDDYETFRAYYPSYRLMNDHQLRSYFTWRTRTRKGEITRTSRSYLLVYVYELINNIGVTSAEDGIEKLMVLLKNYPRTEGTPGSSLTEWIKHYYICNHIKTPFSVLIKRYEVESFYPFLAEESTRIEHCVHALYALSKYKLEDSRFFNPETKSMMTRCFRRVMENITPLFALYGIGLEELKEGRCGLQAWWSPFAGALYAPVAQADRKVVFSEKETYTLQGGRWKAFKPAQATLEAPLLMGYLVKRIEAKLRTLLRYRYKLSPNKAALIYAIGEIFGISRNILSVLSHPDFDIILDQTTELEFAAIAAGVEAAAPPPVVETLREMCTQEPYLTFMRMRSTVWAEYTLARGFTMQAQILTDLTDVVAEVVPFESSLPRYDEMTNEQLRCYCAWRTKIRAGSYPEIPEAYKRLYVFELLNGVEEAVPDRILEKLAMLLKQYSSLSRSFETMLLACIKEYYLCMDSTQPFYDVVEALQIAQYYPNLVIAFSEQLGVESFRKITNYSIEKSKFYTPQTAPMIHECFLLVFEALERYFAEDGVDLKQVICGNGIPSKAYKPFKHAICDCKPTAKKRVVLCSNEIYVYAKKEWTCEATPEKDNAGSLIIGYALKRMEAKLREGTRYKYQITADVFAVANRLLNARVRRAVLAPGFVERIDHTVARYLADHPACRCLQPTGMGQPIVESPVVVQIDRSKLDKIREEADKIRDKLLIEEGERAGVPSARTPVVKPAAGTALDTPASFCATAGEQIGALSNRGDAAARTARNAGAPMSTGMGMGTDTGTPTGMPTPTGTPAPMGTGAGTGMPTPTPTGTGAGTGMGTGTPLEQLCQQLTMVQRGAVALLLQQPTEAGALAAFAQRNQIMLEVLLDEINQLALERIGDTLIEAAEEPPFIYEEYFYDVVQLIV